MRPTFMWKDTGSGNGACPALASVDGGYAVTGRVPTDAEHSALAAELAANDSAIGPGEAVVIVPANVLDRLKG